MLYNTLCLPLNSISPALLDNVIALDPDPIVGKGRPSASRLKAVHEGKSRSSALKRRHMEDATLAIAAGDAQPFVQEPARKKLRMHSVTPGISKVDENFEPITNCVEPSTKPVGRSCGLCGRHGHNRTTCKTREKVVSQEVGPGWPAFEPQVPAERQRHRCQNCGGVHQENLPHAPGAPGAWEHGSNIACFGAKMLQLLVLQLQLPVLWVLREK